MARTIHGKSGKHTTANLGFEAKLWAAADALRNNMDVTEYKHVVLGLVFLKHISDAFEARHAEFEAQRAEGQCGGQFCTHFNDSDWRDERLEYDQRWVFGVPTAGNANFAWVESCN